MSPPLIQAPTRIVQSGFVDSTRWERYRPRDDDIIIGTYPKCGTTWVQHIVGMLVFKTTTPRDITQVSPWLDMKRFGDQPLAAIEAQTHRRFLKTHLPLDAVPVYQGVKFIHVARDGRDAAMSLHNHVFHYSPAFRAQLDNPASQSDTRSGSSNGSIKGPVPGDPAAFFADWVASGGSRGNPDESFFRVANSYWAARDKSDMLLVHFNDLQADLGGEMRRIAAYLGIVISEALWPELIAAAGFAAMKAQGDLLLPIAQQVWDRGASRFFNSGTNGRWREVCAPGDLARYDQLVAQHFTPDQARWTTHGRLAG
ncbi:MAG TPA: sulfotransferase domain-containing protein [Dongiaceae bacterium]|nr:sulfotransferase domain-containing protein [Dongiaceae bacterium]